MSKWFRWYAGTSEDGKIRFAARNAGVTVATVIGVWAALLEDASHDDHRGVVVKNEDYFAAILDLEDGIMEKILMAMEQVHMISVGHGNITICNWKERQFETDATDPTNADRQRRYREKRKSTASQTERNGSVTAEKLPDSDPDPEEQIHKKNTSLPESDAARESEDKFNLRFGGRGGEVSAKAKRRVAAKLGIADPEPIAKLYADWSASETAREPDALFIASAPKIYRNAEPEVKAACSPMVEFAEPPKPIPRASASLIAKLKAGVR